MNSPTSFSLMVSVAVSSVAAVIAFLWVLRAAVSRTELSSHDRYRSLWAGTILLVGWFFAALLSSWLEFYRSARIPTIEFGLLLPILAGVILYRRSTLLRRLVASASQSSLVGIQIYRLEGVIFLVLLAGGYMPGVFAAPAGIGDTAVGVLALPIAWAYARRWRGSTGLVRAWNLLGIADLVVAVTTGFLSSPSPVQALAFDNPNTLITAFPLVMIPVFLVPLAVLLHLASLAKLGRVEASPRRLSPLSAGRGTSSPLA